MADVTPAGNGATDREKLVAVWRDRISRAKEARRPYERIWLSNLAFAAGQHWLVWDDRSTRMRHIAEMDGSYSDRTLYTADRIREYLQAQLGELNSDDDRPDLITAQEGDNAEAIARELNDAVGHAWRFEAKADQILERARRGCLTLGVNAIRARFDASKGPLTDHQPTGQDGKAITDNTALDMLEQHGTLPDGSLPKFTQVREGHSVLESYTAFQILTPPGLTHEDDFPWEILVRPVLVEDLKDEYGAAAEALKEDTDIASAAGLSTGQAAGGQPAQSTPGGVDNSRVRDHCWLYTCFRKPCRSYPKGQTVVLASNQYLLLDEQDELPYEDAAKNPHSGVVYYHWWRLDDRFWSRSFIEPLKDPQRAINEQETINIEIIKAGTPKVFVKKGDLPEKPVGLPMEIVEMEETAEEPHFFNGTGPGTWMAASIEHHAENLAHASTLSKISIGENPDNVDTYSQFFALNESEGRKRDPILTDHRRQNGKLVEFLAFDVREWWPDEKTILVSGDEDTIAQQTFVKSRVPDFYMVNQAEGPAAPRSQAAEIKKVDAIWGAALASTIVQTDPASWTAWYSDSLKAGRALELPEPQKDSQERFAEFENFLMQNGEEVEPAYYDLAPVHIPSHREAQDHARVTGDMETVARIERHIQATLEIQTEVAQQQAALEPAPPPVPPEQQGPPPAGPSPTPGS